MLCFSLTEEVDRYVRRVARLRRRLREAGGSRNYASLAAALNRLNQEVAKLRAMFRDNSDNLTSRNSVWSGEGLVCIRKMFL